MFIYELRNVNFDSYILKLGILILMFRIVRGLVIRRVKGGG